MSSDPLPRLGADTLREIQHRNHGHRDVWLLLWEIQRLRRLVRRGYQLTECLGVACDGTALGIILGNFRRELAGEPCVEEILPIPKYDGHRLGQIAKHGRNDTE